MQTLRNKKGFTLIELLAVIVVLAVVIAIGTTAVFPMVNNIKKGAFVDEANIFMGIASDILNIYDTGAIKEPDSMSDDFQKGANKYCFSLKYLAENGFIDKDIKYFTGEGHEYDGKIIVDMKTDGTMGRYKYTITMHNDLYYINNVTGTVDASNVEDYNNNGEFVCTNADVA